MVYPDITSYNVPILSREVTPMATEWASSTSVRVTIPSADSDDTFNAALDELASKARGYARHESGGWNDSRQVAAVAVDLVQALRSTRAQAMREGKDSGYAIDRTLLRVIENYSDQIDDHWYPRSHWSKWRAAAP